MLKLWVTRTRSFSTTGGPPRCELRWSDVLAGFALGTLVGRRAALLRTGWCGGSGTVGVVGAMIRGAWVSDVETWEGIRLLITEGGGGRGDEIQVLPLQRALHQGWRHRRSHGFELSSRGAFASFLRVSAGRQPRAPQLARCPRCPEPSLEGTKGECSS